MIMNHIMFSQRKTCVIIYCIVKGFYILLHDDDNFDIFCYCDQRKLQIGIKQAQNCIARLKYWYYKYCYYTLF